MVEGMGQYGCSEDSSMGKEPKGSRDRGRAADQGQVVDLQRVTMDS